LDSPKDGAEFAECVVRHFPDAGRVVQNVYLANAENLVLVQELVMNS
jgi:hypothetical protein